MDLKIYIINRKRYLCNKVHYQYGYTNAEEIVYGLKELAELAKAAGFFDIADLYRKKHEKLRDLLPKRGTSAFVEFVESL